MLCTEFGIFCLNSSLLENGVGILVWNFEKIFVKLKNQIPVATNLEKMFEIIKVNFHIFWKSIQKLYFVMGKKIWQDCINLLISFE